jgi:hypothetical protein
VLTNFREPCRTSNLRTFRRSLTTLRQSATSWGRVVAIAPAPLLPGEKETDYAEVALRIVRAAKPRDAIEEFLIRDVVDLTWEILRLRRVKAGILTASAGDGVNWVLAGVGHPYKERDTLCHGWLAGDKRARTKVEAILTKAGMTIDEVTAKTLQSNLNSFDSDCGPLKWFWAVSPHARCL